MRPFELSNSQEINQLPPFSWMLLTAGLFRRARAVGGNASDGSRTCPADVRTLCLLLLRQGDRILVESVQLRQGQRPLTRVYAFPGVGQRNDGPGPGTPACLPCGVLPSLRSPRFMRVQQGGSHRFSRFEVHQVQQSWKTHEVHALP